MKNTIWNGIRTFKGKDKILEVEAEIRNTDSYDWENPNKKVAVVELGISGSIWNGKTKSEKNHMSSGQCLDSIDPEDFNEKAEITLIKEIWKAWHLNGMLCGTKAQEMALQEFYKINPTLKRTYVTCVKYLKTIDLHNDNGYVYGSKWCGRDLPEQVISDVKEVFNKKRY